MMSYEVFREVVAAEIMKYMPEEYKDMKPELSEVHRVNQDRDCLVFRGPDGENYKNSPVLYLDTLYARYKRTEDLYKTIGEAATKLAEGFSKLPEIEPLIALSVKDMGNNIYFQLINTEQNREFLSGIPHREFNDLSIIYRAMIDNKADETKSTVITNGIMEFLQLNEEQLYNLAYKNTKRITPTVVTTMVDIMKKMMLADGVPMAVVEQTAAEMAMTSETQLYVITNSTGINGASTIVYEDTLQELAERMDTNLYVLPSSIHEVIAVPEGQATPEELMEMVEMVNMSEVKLEDRLSNNVYHYDRETKKLSAVNEYAPKLDFSDSKRKKLSR